MKQIEADKHYYNNTFEIKDGILRVDRVYMVDEYRFTQEHYKKLDEIYKTLPQFQGYNGVPYWFGTEEDEFHLWVSFEPSGLQFGGKLQLKDFRNWEEIFHNLLLTADFPYKYLDK